MPDTPLITPRTLKGFRDLLPAEAMARERLIATTVDVYRAYGFSPIETPALEHTEILLGKGGDETDKQTYRFDDPGGRDVSMRFDLTIPLARFAAEHLGSVGTPFRRYHVGTVWRGENTQRGRYREFLQCDFDTIGTESPVADVKTALVIHDVFAALGFGRFTIRVNDRRVLNGVLESVGLADRSTAVLRAIDKLPKIGPDGVTAELTEAVGADPSQIDAVLRLAGLTGSNDEVLAALGPLVGESATGIAGIRSLGDLTERVVAAGVPADRLRIDVSIARGLDYYTGVVFETFLDQLPDIGSCCSGGRYDDLASLYTRQRLPGVGASLGVDRLLAAMDELGLGGSASTWAPVLVAVFDEGAVTPALRTAAELRSAGIGAEVYPEPRKLATQLRYADRRGHRIALIAGPDERSAAEVQVKDLEARTSETVAETEVVAAVRRILDASGPPAGTHN